MRRAQGLFLAQTLGSPQASHQHTPSLRVRSRSPGHRGSGRSHPCCHRSHGSHTQCRWHTHLYLRDNGDQDRGCVCSFCLLGVLIYQVYYHQNLKKKNQQQPNNPWTQHKKALTVTFLFNFLCKLCCMENTQTSNKCPNSILGRTCF